MYAIIAEDGRQYKVEQGQEVLVDLRDAEPGSQVTFERVLAIGGEEGAKIGTPVVEGATVTAEVIGPDQGKKLVVQKFRRRKTFRKKTGHRQLYTKVKIQSING